MHFFGANNSFLTVPFLQVSMEWKWVNRISNFATPAVAHNPVPVLQANHAQMDGGSPQAPQKTG